MSAPSLSDARDTKDVRGTEVAITISDSAMVFGASQASAPTAAPRSSGRRASKSNLKTRKCTPAPPTKGNGRKRLDLSPIPEDKQIRKKIDFEKGLDPDYTLTVFSKGEEPLPDSGVVSGDRAAAEPEEEDDLNSPRSKLGDASKTNEALGGERVKFPEMEHGTKLPFESGLVTSLLGGSHGALAVSHLMETKKDNLLLLANLDSAEELDTMVAQPLLGGGTPEVARRTNGPHNISPLVMATLDSPPPNTEPDLLEEGNGMVGLGLQGGLETEVGCRRVEPGCPNSLAMVSHDVPSPSGTDTLMTETDVNDRLPNGRESMRHPITTDLLGISHTSNVAALAEVDHHAMPIAAPEPLQITASNALVVYENEAHMAESPPAPNPGMPDLGQVAENSEMEVLNEHVLGKSDGELGMGWPIPAPPGSGDYSAPLDEFPPLEKGRTMKIRDRFESVSKNGADGSRSLSHGSGHHAFGSALLKPGAAGQTHRDKETRTAEPCAASTAGGAPGLPVTAGSLEASGHGGVHAASPAETSPETFAGGSASSAPPSNVGKNAPKTMADMLRDRPDPNRPQVFVPEKITNIGFASTSNGLPAIYFSGAEIQKLADRIGHAVVGKFSHSIPNAKQIQKALDNIKFTRGFTWKYINAKHVLIQFEDIGDYARMLSGPKGTPVWYIDRHPMRAFKWTPEFDAYSESPIAAIWCNLIGLPIHLYDQSALFAIGKLLGTPIQVDRATADRSRLSFARMCIEIDITKPPPEEIILDICGREIVQQVRWGKIPAYCHECKHVGHSSDVCYAAGKTERPEKRNYSTAPPKQKNQGDLVTQNTQGRAPQSTRENGKTQQLNTKGKERMSQEYGDGSGGFPSDHYTDDQGAGSGWVGPDILGAHHRETGTREHGGSKEDGRFEGGRDDLGLDLLRHSRDDRRDNHVREHNGGWRGSTARGRGGPRGRSRYSPSGGRGNETSLSFLNSNQFYTLMDNGEFDVDACGENETSEMDIQSSTGVMPNTQHGDGGVGDQRVAMVGEPLPAPGTSPLC